MLSLIETELLALAGVIPLPGFVLIASFVEEIVAPIPSPAVMVTAGSLAQVQMLGMFDLFVLAVIGAVGKAIGAFCVYVIADKAEDVILGRFSRFFGVTHADVERFGGMLSGSMRDYVVLTVLRAAPIIPSVLISAGGGLLKIPLRLFLITTFLGTIVRDGVYLYVGYVGTVALMHFLHTSSRLEDYVLWGIVVCGLGIVGWCIYTKRRTRLRTDMRG